jgi:hypothetical protein
MAYSKATAIKHPVQTIMTYIMKNSPGNEVPNESYKYS